MNGKHYAKKRQSFLAKMLIILMILVIGMPSESAYAGTNDVAAYGYRIDHSYDGKWTKGNVGKTYEEGEWVAFQTQIRNVDWDTLGKIGVEFDFYDDGRFYDLVRNVSVGVDLLPDTHGFPDADGDPFPMGDLENVNKAQRDPNDPNEHYFKDFAKIDLADESVYRAQINIAMDGGTGTETDQTRIFYVTAQQVKDAYLAEFGEDITEFNTVVMYFQLHLARTWIWNNKGDFDADGNVDYPLAYAYTGPPTDKWGGYVYDEDFLEHVMLGSYIYPGSSGHSYVHVIDIDGAETGKKTIPIPDVAETTGMISGYKFEDVDGNGEYDAEIDKPLPEWKIYLRTDLYEIFDIELPTETDENGYYEFVNLPYNLIWELSEYLEEDYVQTHPHEGIEPEGEHTGNVETEWYKEAKTLEDMAGYNDNRADWGWFIKLAPFDHLIQEHIDFGNMTPEPRVMITKTGDALSKIGDEVIYTFEVTNIGNVELTLEDIWDDRFGLLDEYGEAGGFEDTLEVDESQSFDYPYTFDKCDLDPFINVVTANYVYNEIPATDADGFVPTATHETNLFQPCITIEKTGACTARVGETINYTITVTNRSSSDSPDLECTVVDEMLEIDDTFTLTPGGVKVYSEAYDVQSCDSDPLINTATVSASPVGFPNIIEASDCWETDLVHPCCD